MDKKENIRNLMREILDFSKGGSDFWEKRKETKERKRKGRERARGQEEIVSYCQRKESP